LGKAPNEMLPLLSGKTGDSLTEDGNVTSLSRGRATKLCK